MKVKMKGEEHILVNFPIDTSLKKKAHSAMIVPSSQRVPVILPTAPPVHTDERVGEFRLLTAPWLFVLERKSKRMDIGWWLFVLERKKHGHVSTRVQLVEIQSSVSVLFLICIVLLYRCCSTYETFVYIS